ncbi:MAG: hypothetical protein R3343_05825 [Nitriliruptorales bacterium]|nr:hypothetical protein [Nitriliruptorales bacterium]
MSTRTAMRLAAVPTGLCVAMAVATMWLRFVSAPSFVEVEVSGLPIAVGLGVASLFVCVLGMLIVRRSPHNLIGWTFLAAGVGLVFGGFVETYWAWSQFHRGTPAWGAGVAKAFYEDGGALLWAPLLALLMLFPDGRPLPGLWRWVTLAAAAVLTLGVLAPLVDPELMGWFWVANNVMILLGGTALVARFRRSQGLERQQLRWIGASGAVILLGTLVLLATVPLTGEGDAWWHLLGPGLLVLGFGSLPIAATIAITRYRLYDLDRLVSRAATYAVALAAVAGMYVLWVLLVGSVVPGRDSDLAVAVSTLLAAAAFAPLQRRVRVVVDKRFHRQQYDATVAVERLGARLRDQVDDGLLVASVTETLAATLRPAHVAVWVKPSVGAGP